MLVGMIYDRRHTRMIEEFGGLARVTPVYATFFMIVRFVQNGIVQFYAVVFLNGILNILWIIF